MQPPSCRQDFNIFNKTKNVYVKKILKKGKKNILQEENKKEYKLVENFFRGNILKI